MPLLLTNSCARPSLSSYSSNKPENSPEVFRAGIAISETYGLYNTIVGGKDGISNLIFCKDGKLFMALLPDSQTLFDTLRVAPQRAVVPRGRETAPKWGGHIPQPPPVAADSPSMAGHSAGHNCNTPVFQILNL
ncbi:hypothetical protein KSP40_PGU010325 [Platanthera guangdongensis]|uniref:Uncharacterized protein n=1 Tax=Platanthera guangdongensis TaxID=2320717 RepID=A0ABR2LVB8_9ASPA